MPDRQTSKPRWYHFTPDRFLLGLLLAIVFLLLSEWFCWFPFNERKGWTVLLAIALVGAELTFMLLWFIGAMILRRKFQFTIRSLLVLVVVVAIPCSWFMTKLREARKLRETAAAIREEGGYARYYLEDYEDLSPIPDVGPPGPAWLRDLVGVEFLAEVEAAGASASCMGIALDDDDDFFGDDDDMALLERCRSVRRLRLSGSPLTDTGLKHIGGLTRLEYLFIEATSITDDGLVYLREMKNLKYLSLSRTEITGRSFKYLNGVKNLESLALDDTQLTDEELEYVKDMPKLKYLYLSRTQVTGRDFAGLGKMSHLEHLALDDTQFTDKGLSHFGRIEELRYLNLNNTRITDKGMEYLKDAVNLKELFLVNTEVTDDGLEYLAEMKSLRTLNLSGTKVTGAGLKHLEEMKKLWELNLSRTNVSDTGIDNLVKLKSIVILDLSHTPLTSDKWENLGELGNLQELRLHPESYTFTLGEQARLSQTLPKCDIYIFDRLLDKPGDRQFRRNPRGMGMF